MKLLEMENPDGDKQLDFITDSFRFILKFCSSNQLTLDEYLDYKIGFTPEWMKHYADRKISIYSLLDFPNIYDKIVAIEEDHRKLILGDLDSRFYTIKEAYLKSNKARQLVKKGTELIRKQLKGEKHE